MTAGRLARLPPLGTASLAYACGAAVVLAPGARAIPIGAVLCGAIAFGLLTFRGVPQSRSVVRAAIAWLLAGAAATSVSLDARLRDCRVDMGDGARIAFRGALTTLPAAGGDAILRIEESDADGCTGDVRARIRAGSDSVAMPMPGAELRGRGRWLAAGYVTREPAYAGTLFVDQVETLAQAGSGHHPLLSVRGAAQRRV